MLLTKPEEIKKLKWKDIIYYSCDYCDAIISKNKRYFLVKKTKNNYCNNSCQIKHNQEIKYRTLENTQTKVCCNCNCEKNIDDFYKLKSGTPKKNCKECAKIVSRSKYKRKNNKITIKSKTCDSCNIDIENGKKKYCTMCKQFTNYRKLFGKLNVAEHNLLLANQKSLDILLDEYFVKNLSLIEIKNKYNIMYNTVHFYFKINGIKLRSTSDSQSLAYEMGRINVVTSPKYKQGWYTTWDGRLVYYHSSYELEYCKILDSKKIVYQMESVRIKYFDTQKNKNRIAIPDFYLPESNTLIEIKSKYTFDEQNMKDKLVSYNENGYNFKLILDKKEYSILVD
jgi:hypothetical protein